MPGFAAFDPSRPPTHSQSPASIEAGHEGVGMPNPLPLYCVEADEPNEPDTIAKKLFIFGFMFPLLWLVGACILCVPLRAYPLPTPDTVSDTASTHSSSTLRADPSAAHSDHPDPAPSYTKYNPSAHYPRPANLDTVWTQPLVDLYGRAERHWAWRCVWALLALCLIGVTVVCALVGAQVI